MSYKALVIDDDPAILNTVDDILASLEHEYDWAWCQQQARDFLKDNEYSYILLDLEIPVRTKGSARRVQNSLNLLDEIRGTNDGIPVIIMAPDEVYNPGMAVKMIKQGATDFVEKPFPCIGRTLDKAIKKAMAGKTRYTPPSPPRVVTPPKPQRVQPFKGGELVFYPDRVEICETKILGDTGIGHMRNILEALKETKASGKYVSYSGAQLAKRVGARGGQNAIAGCIRGFRNTVIKTLKEESGLICGRQDVIQSGDHGYRLNEWITVRENDSDFTVPQPSGHGTVNGTVNAPSGTVKGRVNGTVSGIVNDRVEKRRRWILAALQDGRQMRVPELARGLQCSLRTARRELDWLKSHDMIKFVGAPRTGYYCVKG